MRLLRHAALLVFATAGTILLAGRIGALQPRGEWLAWVADRWHSEGGERAERQEIYLWDRGSIVNISKHPSRNTDPEWSGQGQLAWVSDRNSTYDVYILSEGVSRNISQSARGIGGYVWSRDGQLAWVAWNPEEGWPGETVYVWDGSHTQRVSPRASVDWPIAWTDEGTLRWSGWAEERTLRRYIYTWDGGETQATPLDLASISTISWFPDGEMALLVGDSQNADMLYLGRTDHGQRPAFVYSEYGMVGSVARAPDGRLAWVEVQAPGSVRIVVWDGAIAATIPVSDAPRAIRWSHDGRLAWADGNGGGRWMICVWDGERVMTVHNGMLLATPPQWSASGRLAWAGTHGREWGVWVWDGASAYRVSPQGQSATDPAWG
jgi:hypothetical protein